MTLIKYIIVTGGVISGLGKGITASSIGLLLQSYGMNVTAIKIDPYLNVDAGTMSPFEHGECYVLADGGEGDLDLGNYERFLNINLTRDHNITTGKIYQSVINKEREGKYLGKTVQIIPHVTNEIKNWIDRVAKNAPKKYKNDRPNVCIIELGGTVGDIGTAPYIEALRLLSREKKTVQQQCCFVHVSLIIDNGELKTKPTQHSVATLRSLGINPDLLVMRTKNLLSAKIKNKLNIFCHVSPSNIISNINVKNIYFVPKIFSNQQICQKITQVLGIKNKLDYDRHDKFSKNYSNILNHFTESKKKIKILIAGKYTGSQDTYLSLIRAIEHASFVADVHTEIIWFNTRYENQERDIDWNGINAVIIPGGFGDIGINGKIKIAKYARINKIPLLGICLGMQIMVVEFARHIGINATSSEWVSINKGKNYINVIDILPNQTKIKGGTMRLGNYETKLVRGSLVEKLYKTNVIVERHRHRYEVNNKYVKVLEKNKLYFVGTSNNTLMELIELACHEHPFYVGCQFHPEYSSRYDNPHPLFVGLVKRAKNNKLFAENI